MQNHKGAMIELGEGLGKLRKMKFSSGPFLEFELEISATLDFIYQTQIELAACKYSHIIFKLYKIILADLFGAMYIYF